MASLTFLGTAPGVPMPGRNQTALLLQAHGDRVLIDAGEPCSRVLRELGVPFGAIRAVLLTHAHSDHIGGLPMFLQSCWVEGRSEPLDLHLPGELIDPLTAWLKAVYLPVDRLGFPVRMIPWAAGSRREIAGLHFTPFPTTHLDSLRERFDPAASDRFHAFSLSIGWAGVRIAVSGDLGGPADLDPHLSAPLDLLVCELSHFDAETLCAHLGPHSVRRLALTHFGPSQRANAARILRTVRERLPRLEALIDPADGDHVEF